MTKCEPCLCGDPYCGRCFPRFFEDDIKDIEGESMLYKKIVNGYVIQTFNEEGQCLSQRFSVADDPSFELEDGNEINEANMPFGGNEYFPFDMVQPE